MWPSSWGRHIASAWASAHWETSTSRPRKRGPEGLCVQCSAVVVLVAKLKVVDRAGLA
jgi:hypothetical protein